MGTSGYIYVVGASGEGMRKGTNKTPGQMFYEVWASEDRSNRYHCEWREVPDDDKTRIEDFVATQVRAWLQEKQADHED